MTPRLRVGVFLPIIAVLTGAGVGCAFGAGAVHETTVAGSPSSPTAGKALYRTYCSQCHVLAAADAAGFGSDDGLGQSAGPSFTDLYVPYGLAIVAVTEARGPRAHRIAVGHLTWQQLDDIADFLAADTATNPRGAPVRDR